MDRSDTGEMNLHSPNATVVHSEINRGLRLPSFFHSGLASAIGAFCIGLLSGAVGGLLLGGTAVVVLQSLELLADNRLLMDQLEINYDLKKTAKEIVQRETDNQVHGIPISIFVQTFGVFSSFLSLLVGIFFGLSTYAVAIKKHGEAVEAAMGKAFSLAGPVCLMGFTATGCFLGLALESFLSITLNISVLMWLIISVVVTFVFLAIQCLFNLHLRIYEDLLLFMSLIPVALLIAFITCFASVSTNTNTSSAVLEGMFVGVLTTQMWTAAIGMLLFVSWQRGGAHKICAGAAGSGGAVLAAIKAALPVLGPGPTIGALTGVAGAVGVSLAAGAAAADNYGLWGRLGVTVGAAVGAFLSSCAHSGLSGMLMGLCAATIPAGSYLILLHSHFP
ncbi:uncharacterized protein [Trachinotus anak]|uniref:uncharacterized protein isoform X4 n=1 Tax=Trachinotus anak TaxID=443729 RepID=UPI0039F22A38